MLGSCKYFSFFASSYHKMCIGLIFALLFLVTTALRADDFHEEDFSWIPEYFSSISKDSSIEDLLYSLDVLRNELIIKGYNPPSLSNLAILSRGFLINNKIDLDQSQFEDLFYKILEREGVPFFRKSSMAFADTQLIKRRGHINDENLTDGFAIGFCKFLAGALCMLIDNPYVRGIGGTLITSGIDDMLKNEEKPKFMGKTIGAQRISCA